MVQESDTISYQKPELVQIDDPAFDETGQGTSYHDNNGKAYGHYDGKGNNG